MNELITPSELIRDLLKKQFGSQFKAYFIGDRFNIPVDYMPCIVIEKERTVPTVGATGTDNQVHTIRVKVVVNKRDDFKAKNTDVLLWRHKLEKMIEARDAQTGDYMPTTILGVLRKNLTMNGRFTSSEVTVEYGQTPRSQDLITEEGHIILNLSEMIIVRNRL